MRRHLRQLERQRRDVKTTRLCRPRSALRLAHCCVYRIQHLTSVMTRTPSDGYGTG